jgi:tetratricopeptide (TPR) repeat protein
MKYNLLIILVIIICNGLSAQEILPASHPAQKRCEKVYKKLLNAIGDNRKTLPDLLVTKRKKRVASYRIKDNVILIEKAAYDICEKMGADSESALAFLIGHELTHYYQKADWGRSGEICHFLLKSEILKQYSSEDEEADSYSGFISYLAGLRTLEIIPDFLEKIYKDYNFNNKIDGYPDLEDRKKVIYIVQRKVRKYIQMYESANYYLAVGWNYRAISCYKYLLEFIKTKELYNNAGVVSLAAAIEHPENDGYSFLYPIDIDLSNVFKRSYSLEDRQGKLLKDAEEYIKKALILDESYCTSYVNLACVYDLMGNATDALTTLNIASNLSSNNLEEAKISIIRGIVYAHNNQIKKANEHFETATQHYKSMPIIYVSRSNKQAIVKGEKEGVKYNIEIKDQMDGLFFGDKLKRSSGAIPLRNSSILNTEVDFSTKARSYFSRFMIENKLDSKISYAFLQRSRNKGIKTKRDIKVGDSYSKIKKAYEGMYFQVVHYSKGFFLVYPQKGLVFRIDQQKKLREWAIFAEY